MNECEQLHPLLKGYLEDRLSARDRRVVARHLNLCAAARKELDRLRGGGAKSAPAPPGPPSEPLDLKVLRWMFRKPPASPPREAETASKRAKPPKPPSPALSGTPRSTALKPILGVLLLFVVLIFVTHLIQNAGENSFLRGAKRWLSRNHVMGVSSSLDMVLDLSNLPHWSGDSAPVAFATQEVISDPVKFKVLWALLQPNVEAPEVDFTKYSVAAIVLGPKAAPGTTAKFKRMENFTDKTVIWYDEVTLQAPSSTSPAGTGPWVLQTLPKPSQQPVLIQKIQ